MVAVGNPIKIGYAISLSGPQAANGKSALLAQRIWEEDINASGGLRGRPVKLVYYDDQSNPATVPSIYAKLLDVDKVELIIGPYGTNSVAPAMPIAMQRNKLLIGLFTLGVNSEFKYPRYFSMTPNGPNPKVAITKGLLRYRHGTDPKPQTVAIVAADAEFARNASDGARENANSAGLKIVYDKLDHLNTAVSSLCRAGDPGDEPGCRRDLLVPGRVRRHRASNQRVLGFASQDDRRRHG